MIGERIKQARDSVLLSQRGLAARVGVSAMAISKYENGHSLPSSRVLVALSDVLGVSTDYFLRADEPEPDIAFIGFPRLPLKRRNYALLRIRDAMERVLELERYLPVLPAFEPPTGLPRRVAHLDDVEEFAQAVREGWQLGRGPLSGMAAQFAHRGLPTLNLELGGYVRFAGAAALCDGHPLLVAARGLSASRLRLALAHALGTVLLDRRLAPQVGRKRALDRFARALLLPRSGVLSSIGHRRTDLDLRELALLDQSWGVGMIGWLDRARDLRIISGAARRRLRGRCVERGWELADPLPGPPTEAVNWFEHRVLRALTEGLITESKAAELLAMPALDLQPWRRLEEPGIPCADSADGRDAA